MSRKIARAAAVLLLFALPGCGPSTGIVSGTVHWEGQPIPLGQIVFRDEDNRSAPDVTPIINGAYYLAVKPGKKRVEIYAQRRLSDNEWLKQREFDQYIPDRYNVKSSFVTTIVVGKAATLAFDLQEAP